MNEQFEYRGYLGSAEVDIESGVLVGKLLFIRDTITYSATTVPELEEEFRLAVEDYLRSCAESGDEPNVPFKGSFNVRVGPERHRAASIAARIRGMNLNEFVSFAIEQTIDATSRIVLHKHEVSVTVTGDGTRQVTALTGTGANLEVLGGNNWSH